MIVVVAAVVANCNFLAAVVVDFASSQFATVVVDIELVVQALLGVVVVSSSVAVVRCPK